MSEKVPNPDSAIGSPNDSRWDFHDVVYQGDKDAKMLKSEDDAILAEVTPYIEKINPAMLKKVFDGWKDRRHHYRKMMREEEAMAEFNDEECDAWADLFYLGTIFRDYLDTILDLKRPEKSGFQLLDSTEKEVAGMGNSMGWFNSSEHLINIVGDRFNNKYDYLCAIAHEMWHAHQAQVAEEEDSDKSDTYFEAFHNYIGIENPEKNKDQLLEKEAYAFQYLFEQKLSEAMMIAPEMEEILLEESDNILSFEDYMRLAESNWYHDLQDDDSIFWDNLD